MKATQHLPPSYAPYLTLSPDAWRRTNWFMMLLSLVVAGVSWVVLNRLAEIMRQDYRPANVHLQSLSLERLMGGLQLLAILVVVVAAHEFVHALFIRLFTGQWPRVVAGGGGIALRLPSWYLPRNQFLAANLAPGIAMTLVGLLLIQIANPRTVGLAVFFTALNLAGSTADFASSAYLSLHPETICIDLDKLTVYSKTPDDGAPRSSMRRRARTMIEAALSRRGPRG